MTAILWTVFALAVLVAVLLALSAYGRLRWARATRKLLDRLEAARRPALGSAYDVRELEALPAPVQRFFRTVLKDGQPIVTGATVPHAGAGSIQADITSVLRRSPYAAAPTDCRRPTGLPNGQA